MEESHDVKTSPIRSHKLSDAPRTPTPFKRALADVYQRCEPLSNTVISNNNLMKNLVLIIIFYVAPDTYEISGRSD